MDGWRADYRSNWVYQNASYGYSGYYLDRGEYSYYFREGFRRGYEDGYYSRYQYGSYNNGSYSIIGAVLNTILGLQPYSYRY
jgi:aryl-phospho-beta-D-glucosidase BglC (GH1 family)